MALSATERSRLHRERKRQVAEQERLKGGDDAADLYRTPFSEFAERDSNIGECFMYMALAGMEFPEFNDERDANEFVFDRAAFGDDDDLFDNAVGALGRAEVMIGLLNDTAITLAGAVNQYKKQEIKSRLAELEQSKEIDRATAMNEAVRLNKILDRLNKQVRMPFPQWKVTGV